MKTIKLLFVFCLIPFLGFAQVDKDPIKTQIREVKLSEKHVYAQATSNVGIPEAKQIALDQLHANVIGLFSEAGKTKEEAENLWNTNMNQCQYIVSQNEDLFQAFVYIPKSSFFLGDTAVTLTTVTPAIQVDTTAIATKADSTNIKTVVVVPEVAIPTTPLPAEKEFTMDDKTAELILKFMQPIPSVSKLGSAKVTKIEKIAPQTPIENKSILDALPESSREIVKKLLSISTYKEAISYLYTMKEEGRMVYGRIKTMTSPENSYILITKDDQLVTILNKGVGERINLKTNQTDPIKNYVGHSVIWFQIF